MWYVSSTCMTNVLELLRANAPTARLYPTVLDTGRMNRHDARKTPFIGATLPTFRVRTQKEQHKTPIIGEGC